MDAKFILCSAAALLCLLPVSESNPYTAMRKKLKNLEIRMKTKIDTLETDLRDDLMFSVLPTMLPELIQNMLDDLVLTDNNVIDYKEEMKRMKTWVFEMKGQVMETMQLLEKVQARNLLLEEIIRRHRLDVDIKLFNLSTTDQVISEQFADLTRKVDTICKSCCTTGNCQPEVTSSASRTPSSVLRSTSKPTAASASSNPSTAFPEVTSSISTSQSIAVPTTSFNPRTNTTGLVTALYGSSTMKLIDINSKMMTDLPVQASAITTVAYDPATGMLFWSQGRPQGIYSSYPNKGNTTLLKADIWSECMTVDSGRGLLAIGDTITSAICWMTLDGEDFRVIAWLGIGNGPRSIAVDTTREELYVAHDDRLFKMSYNGKNKEKIAKGRIFGLSMDNVGDALFYGVGISIKRIPLSGSGETHVANVRDNPWVLVYYDGRLYVNYWEETGLDIVNTSNGSVDVNAIEMEEPSYRSYGRYARHGLCLIT